MKTLYIIRHAKSDWSDSSLKDFDRPLNERWKNDAKKLWEYIKDKSIKPDIIFSSPAKRAKSTIKIICKETWFDKDEIIFNEDIYNYHMKWIDFLLSFIMEIDDEYDKVFLVWHNNSLSELISYLIWKDNSYVKTWTMTKLRFDIKSWREVDYWNWKL